MSTSTPPAEAKLAKLLAAEDVQPDDYVAVLNEILEFPSFLWDCSFDMPSRHEPVRVKWRSLDNGTPLKVIAVCLPFVFVKQPCGKSVSLDIRASQLVRLDRVYGRRVWKAMKKNRKHK